MLTALRSAQAAFPRDSVYRHRREEFRQAADAMPGRIGRKYVSGLELTDADFAAWVPSEFRTRLQECHAAHQLFEKLLLVFNAKGWMQTRGRQRYCRRLDESRLPKAKTGRHVLAETIWAGMVRERHVGHLRLAARERCQSNSPIIVAPG